MPTYIVLAKFTDQGVKDIKGLPERLRARRTELEQAGGKWLGWYLTEGQYDAVAIMERPDDQSHAVAMLNLAREGRVRTETLRAFTEQETEQIIQKLG